MLNLTSCIARRAAVSQARGRTTLLAAALALTLCAGATSAQFVQVDAGAAHSLALGCDGTISAWSSAPSGASGLLNVPALPPGLTYVEIAAGGRASLARRSDGSVVAWGLSDSKILNVPALLPGLSYVEIAVGYDHALARLSDGSVVAWGDNGSGQCDVPALPPGLTYVQLSAGGSYSEYLYTCPFFQYYYYTYGHSVALVSDGSVVAWGSQGTSVPPLPPGLTYVEVSGGGAHTVARLSDGSVVAWGDNRFGQLGVPVLPAGVTFADIDAGGGMTAARLSDGSTVVWGAYGWAASSVPASIPAPPSGSTYVDVAAGGHYLYSYWTAWDSDQFWCLVINDDYIAGSSTVALLDDGSVADWTGGPAGIVSDLGLGLAGATGLPVLTGSVNCTPTSPTTITLTLTNALPNSTTTLVLGLTELDLPFKGGTLVPSPDILVFGLPTGPAGTHALSDQLPQGIPSGIDMYFQHWIVDAAGPGNLSASNGLSVTTP